MQVNLKRYKLLKEKFLKDAFHFEYLKKRGLSSFEIANTLNHEMFHIMRLSLMNEFSNLSEQEIDMKMREISELELKIRNKRMRYKYERN